MEVNDYIILVFTNVLTIISILNPFGNVPLFMSLTQEQKPEIREKIYNTIVVSGFGIVVAFVLIGNLFMTYLFKINLNELRVAGGIILILVALKNLLGLAKVRSKESNLMTMDEAVKYAVTPLTFPMFVGPGTISTAMIIRQESGIIVAVLAVLLTFTIVKILFSVSKYLDRIFGELVLFVLSRVMQIFIMSVGVKMIIFGLRGLLQ
ncbi:MAG: MarC family protein, partial [Fusobacteriaceae bacterium]